MRRELAWLSRGARARATKPKFHVAIARALIEDVPPLRNEIELKRMAMARLGKQVVDLEHATVRFGDKTVLDDVSWIIGPGDRFGIVGANGPLACGAALTIMLVGLAVFQLCPALLLGMFNPSDSFLSIGTIALRTISWSFPVAAICIILGASFQALGNGIYSTIVSLCRQLVVLLPVGYLLSLGGNVDRVWLAWPIAEVVSGAVTVYFFLRLWKQKIRPIL